MKEILTRLEIPYIDDDLSLYLEDFNTSKLINTSMISKSGYEISLTPKGLDYLHNYDKLKELERREQAMKDFQFLELQKKVEVLDKQIKEQSEFHRSSSERNKEDITLIKDKQLLLWVNLGIALLALFISLIQFLK